MEMSYEAYIKNINYMLDEKTIHEAVNNLKSLGKFIMSDNGQWEPVYYPGYTLITPTSENDYDNADSYEILQDFKRELSVYISSYKCVEAPDNALHMTLARLISGRIFETTMMGNGESGFLDYLEVLFSKLAISGQLKFEIKGISVFPQGVIAAMISPVHKDDYKCLQNFREHIYSDKVIKEAGVEQKREFKGHITLFYIEKELDRIDKELLSSAIININRKFFMKSLPFCIGRGEVRKFKDFLSFEREENWPSFEFI